MGGRLVATRELELNDAVSLSIWVIDELPRLKLTRRVMHTMETRRVTKVISLFFEKMLGLAISGMSSSLLVYSRPCSACASELAIDSYLKVAIVEVKVALCLETSKRLMTCAADR